VIGQPKPGRFINSALERSDPMTGEAEWALRSYQDKPDATRWGGQNVYDVRSRSSGTALDGTKYGDW
jgi:general secretion pathway protein G